MDRKEYMRQYRLTHREEKVARRIRRNGPPKPRVYSQEWEEHKFKPGESGNPAGRPKSITLSEAYRHVLERKFPGKNHTWCEEIAERMAKQALKRVTAAQEMADRTEGKPPVSVDLSNRNRLPPPIVNVAFIKVPELPDKQGLEEGESQ